MQQTKQIILNVIFVLFNRYTMIKRAKHNIKLSCSYISYSISWEQTIEGDFWHYEVPWKQRIKDILFLMTLFFRVLLGLQRNWEGRKVIFHMSPDPTHA